MTQNLTSEQIAYLKELDSKKKRRKFLLDCLVESVIGESEKYNYKTQNEIAKDLLNHVPSKSDIEFTENGLWRFKSTTTAPRTFESIPKQIKISGCDTLKGNYNVKAIDKKDELLKFDVLGNEKCDICRIYDKIKDSNKCESCNSCVKHIVENSPMFEKYRSDKSANYEAKFTYLDMVIAFYKGRQISPRVVLETKNEITYGTDKSFDDWFKEFKKQKKND